jgi:type I restriction enzyme M protein
MPDVNRLLDNIWLRFSNVGVSNDDIIEHLAALLTEEEFGSPDPDLQLRKQLPRDGLNLEDIRNWLFEAVDATDERMDVAGKKAALFDRYILFRLPQMQNGYFPTPRHIAQYMRRLVRLEKEHSLADFACGSGGLLVEREDDERQPREIIGIDVSPDAAKLAWTNMVLHGNSQPEIRVRDAFRAIYEIFPREQFDRILLAPPFGGAINADLARKIAGYETSGESAVAFTALVLHKLKEDGCAAILVPSGLLFRSDSGSTNVRNQLVGKNEEGNFTGIYYLEAVISLPADALRPYSSRQTHLLLVSKRNAYQERPLQGKTWFFRTANDGYDPGIRRGILTGPPKMPNDLILTEEVLRRQETSSEGDQFFPENEQPVVAIKNTTLQNGQPSVLVEALGDAQFLQVQYRPRRENVSAFFLIESELQDSGQFAYLCLPVDQEGMLQLQDLRKGLHTNRDELLKNLYGESDIQKLPSRTDLLSREMYGKAVSIAKGDGLFGVAIATKGIQLNNLQPGQYVKTLGDIRAIESPAVLLGRIQSRQADFLQQVDRLLGRVDLPPIAGTSLPSPLAQEKAIQTDKEREIEPFAEISREQRHVWESICKLSEEHKDQNGYFTFKDLIENGVDGTVARLTLELFEWMGVIVPTTLVKPNSQESLKTTLYRRVTQRDIWKQ